MIQSRIAVCILAHNRRQDLFNTLVRIKNIKGLVSECLVLDNASSDGTLDMLNDFSRDYPRIRIFRSEENLGIARGRNFLWERTRADLILALDDDILIDSQALTAMLREIESSDSSKIISPNIVESGTGRRLNSNKVFWRGDTLYEACFLLPRKILENVGPFDPALFVAAEGQDYAIRVRKAGYEILRTDSAEVIHVQRERGNDLNKERRLKWIWSFSYVYYKNFQLIEATIKTLRVLLSMVRHDIVDFGTTHSFGLFSYAAAGAKSGIIARRGD